MTTDEILQICIDCGAEGRMRFVVATHGPQPLGHILRDDLKLLANYAQAGVTVFKDASRINPERDSVAIYTAPVAAPQRETNVVEALRRCLDELKGHNDSPYCDFRDSFNDIMEQAESALGAKNVDRAPHARDAVAWMPDTGYVFAPDKNTSNAPAPQPTPEQSALVWECIGEIIGCYDAAFIEGLDEALAQTTDLRLKDLVERRLLHAMYAAQACQPSAAPQREWQSLTEDEIKNTWASIGGSLPYDWFRVEFYRAIEAALRAKNTGEQA